MKKAFLLLVLGLALALGLFAGMGTATASPTPGFAVQLPVLGFLGQTGGGDVIIEVQNVGTAYNKAVLVLWGATRGFCEPQAPGPFKYECTGLLKPGAAWIWTEAQLPATAFSGIVFAAAECPRSLGWPFPLVNGVLTPSWANTQPLAVEVIRKFPGATGDISSAYSGISPEMEGVFDPVYGGFMYYAPVVYGDNDGLTSWLYIQNSGNECTSVELWFKWQEFCLRATICEVMALAPGETIAYDVATNCIGPGFVGSVWIRTSQPMGIVVDQVGADILMTYHAKPAELNYVFNGTPYYSSGSQVAYGPLIYREEYGWDTRIYVQNLSSITNARVKVYFLDNSGDIITVLVDWVCPRGSTTFFLPMVNNLPGNYVGQVRVESQEWWTPGDPKVLAPDIQAVAELIKFEGPARANMLEAMAYDLFPEDQAFDWQLGVNCADIDRLGLDDWNASTVAIPSLHKRGNITGVTSELAIGNLNPNPGFTDFAIFIYDQNGLLDQVCEKLNEKQVEYIDLNTWGYVNPGFKGSAVIQALFSTQFPSGFCEESVIAGAGLAAVKVERSMTTLGVDIPGDESAASEGFPLFGDFHFQGPQFPVCPGMPEPCTAAIAGTLVTHNGGNVLEGGHLIQIFPVPGEGDDIFGIPIADLGLPVATATTDNSGHFALTVPGMYLDDCIEYFVVIDGQLATINGALTAEVCCTDQLVWEVTPLLTYAVTGKAVEACAFEGEVPFTDRRLCDVDVDDIPGRLKGAQVWVWRCGVEGNAGKVAGPFTTNEEGFFRVTGVPDSLVVGCLEVKICFLDGNGNNVCFVSPCFRVGTGNPPEFRFLYNSCVPDLSEWCPLPANTTLCDVD